MLSAAPAVLAAIMCTWLPRLEVSGLTDCRLQHTHTHMYFNIHLAHAHKYTHLAADLAMLQLCMLLDMTSLPSCVLLWVESLYGTCQPPHPYILQRCREV